MHEKSGKQGTTPPQKKQKSQPLPPHVINLRDRDESHNSEGSAAVEAGRRAKPRDLSEGPICKFLEDGGPPAELSIFQLKVFMRKEGLRLTGNKAELVERVENHLKVPQNGNDGGVLDEEEEEGEEEETGSGRTQSLKLPDAKVCQYVADGGELGKLSLWQLKLYLRQNKMRRSGNKPEIIDRIKLHIRLKKEGAQALFPRLSFTVNCKGDVCKGDIVLFQQQVYPECVHGVRTVAGSVTKESYGHLKQQHTFTIEVLWTSGPRPLQVMEQLRIKGRYLYKIETLRQPWYDEKERKAILDEKHERGAAARFKRCGKVKRVRDTESIPASPKIPKTPKIYKTQEIQMMGIEPIEGTEQQGYKVKPHKIRTKSVWREKQEDKSSTQETLTGSIAGETKSITFKTHKTSTEPISAGNEEQVHKVRMYKTHGTLTESIAGGGMEKQDEYKGKLSQQQAAPNHKDLLEQQPTLHHKGISGQLPTPDQIGIQRTVTIAPDQNGIQSRNVAAILHQNGIQRRTVVVTTNQNDIRRSTVVVTPDQNDIRRSTVVVTPDQNGVRRTVAGIPDFNGIRRSTVVVTPDQNGIRRTVAGIPDFNGIRRIVVVTPNQNGIRRTVAVTLDQNGIRRTVAVTPDQSGIRRTVAITPYQNDIRSTVIVTPDQNRIRRTVAVTPYQNGIRRTVMVPTPHQNAIQRIVAVVHGLPEQRSGCRTPHCKQVPARGCYFASCGTCCPRGGLCKKHGKWR